MPKKEVHTGIVQDNQDPEQRGRLTILCPTVVGDDVLEWCEPLFHFVDSAAQAGSFWIPNIDSEVEVEIEAEEDSEIVGLSPKWRCAVYPEGTVPTEFQTNYPNRRGWKTKAGHILFFDDTEDQNEFYYQHPTGANIKVDNEGNIEINPASGKSALIGDGADQQFVRGNKLSNWISGAAGLLFWLDSHQHLDPVSGTTSGPTTGSPTPPSDLLSDYHKVK